MMKNFEH